MRYNTKNALALIVAIQILFFMMWFGVENSKLNDSESRTILVKTVPVDPRDLISGNYFILNYEFSSVRGFNSHSSKYRGKNGKEVFVVLKQEENRFVPDYFSFDQPKIYDHQAMIKGIFKNGRFRFGIEKYFINENQKEPNSRTDDIEVLLIIDDDLQPRIKSLTVNGQLFQ